MYTGTVTERVTVPLPGVVCTVCLTNSNCFSLASGVLRINMETNGCRMLQNVREKLINIVQQA
jgi:hypothetical protein